MFDKAPAIQKDAAQAWATGVAFFTPVLNGGKSNNDWGTDLTAITQAGWKLHTWAVSENNVGQPQAFPLFTR
jgi:hypothetical protein